MGEFPNLISAIGITATPDRTRLDPNVSDDAIVFKAGATLDIGPFGAIVIGLNGAGKTRLLNGIGREFDLIYSNEHRVGFDGLISDVDEGPQNVPNEIDIESLTWHIHHGGSWTIAEVRNNYWNALNLFAEFATENGLNLSDINLHPDRTDHLSDPRRGSERWRRTSYSSFIALRDLQALELSGTFLSLHELSVLAISRCTYPSQAAMIFSSLLRRFPWIDISGDDPLFIITLALATEIFTKGSIGIRAFTGPIEGDTPFLKFGLWYNFDPDTMPVLARIKEAAGKFAYDVSTEGEAAEIAGNNGWLNQGQQFVLERILGASLTGPFEHRTPDIPLEIPRGDNSIFRPGSDRLVFEGFPALADAFGSHVLFGDLSTGHDLSYQAKSSQDYETLRSRDRWLKNPRADPNLDASHPQQIHPWETAAFFQSVSNFTGYTVSTADPPSYTYSPTDWIHAKAFVQLTNAILRRLLEAQAPTLDLCSIAGTLRWQPVIETRSSDGTTSRSLHEMKDLSMAQLRWSKFAIGIAERFLLDLVDWIPDVDIQNWVKASFISVGGGPRTSLPGQLVIIDEPELGLHRRAEESVARGIVELANLCGFKPIVATHSPTFVKVLTEASANIFWVHKDPTGEARVETFSSTDLATLQEATGSTAADLLQIMRGIVFVEGEHDKAVLGEVFKSEFARLGIHVIPFRGVHGLAQIVDSSILWHFTQAEIIIVLDHLAHEPVYEIWKEAVSSCKDGRPKDAVEVVKRLAYLKRSGNSELEAVSELFRAAIEAENLERIHLIGLSKHDIINYFEPTSILKIPPTSADTSKEKVTWEQLVEAWRSSGSKRDFKKWLVQEKYRGSRLSADRLAKVAGKWDHVPEDFTLLLDEVRRILAQQAS